MGLVRLILALGVVLHHTGTLTIMNGGLAVEIFFVISGFYMALVLDGKYARHTALFYSNRLLRLAPAYFAALVLQVAAILWLDAGEDLTRTDFIAALHGSAPLQAVLATNLSVLGQEWASYFSVHDGRLAWGPGGLPAWHMLLVPQAWSISIELVFYALAPFLARNRTAVIVLFVCSLLLRIGLETVGADHDTWIRRFFPATLHLFLLGMLSYSLSRPLRPRIDALPRWLPWTVIAVLAVALRALRASTPLNLVVLDPLVCLYAAAVIPLIFYKIKNRADRLLGELSYPVYIFHVLIIGLLIKCAGLARYELSLAAVLVTLSVAAIFYLLVDGPVDAWRQRRASSLYG